MENPIKMDDLGVPLFSETPILNEHHFWGRNVRKITLKPEVHGWSQYCAHLQELHCKRLMTNSIEMKRSNLHGRIQVKHLNPAYVSLEIFITVARIFTLLHPFPLNPTCATCPRNTHKVNLTLPPTNRANITPEKWWLGGLVSLRSGRSQGRCPKRPSKKPGIHT